MRTQFTFYASFFSNFKILINNHKATFELMDALESFCILDEEPVFTENIARLMFETMRHQLSIGNLQSKKAKVRNFKLSKKMDITKVPIKYLSSLKNEIDSRGGNYSKFFDYCVASELTSQNFMTTYSVLKAKNNKANPNHTQQSENALEVPQNDFKHLFDMETIENFPPVETDYGTVEEFEDFKELLENVESNVYIRSGKYLYTYDFEKKEIIADDPNYEDKYCDDAIVCFYIGWKEKGFQYNLSNI